MFSLLLYLGSSFPDACFQAVSKVWKCPYLETGSHQPHLKQDTNNIAERAPVSSESAVGSWESLHLNHHSRSANQVEGRAWRLAQRTASVNEMLSLRISSTPQTWGLRSLHITSMIVLGRKLGFTHPFWKIRGSPCYQLVLPHVRTCLWFILI
jgi:hypothetical protein